MSTEQKIKDALVIALNKNAFLIESGRTNKVVKTVTSYKEDTIWHGFCNTCSYYYLLYLIIL